MALNKVEICGVDTSKLPTITPQQSRDMLLKIKEGDERTREEFIKANLRLVLSVIQRFQSRSEQPDDLFQVGCIGLIKAIDNFNTDLNVRFSTYAVPMIIGEIRRHLRDFTSIRVSRSLRDIAYKALSSRARLAESTMREPAISDIAKDVGFPEEVVAFALDAIQDPVSLFEPVYHDNGDAIYVMDQVRDDKNTDESWLIRIAIDGGLNHLPEREKKIIYKRFFEGKTQMEVSADIGISQAQVSRLEKNALKEMKKFVE